MLFRCDFSSPVSATCTDARKQQVHGAPDVRLDFKSKQLRDDVIKTLKSAILTSKASVISRPSSPKPSPPRMTPTQSSASSILSSSTAASSVSSSPYIISPVRTSFQASIDRAVVLGQQMEEHVAMPAGLAASQMPKVLGTIGSKQVTGLHFVCLTIGSRGDVQPYISLAKELMKDGNRWVRFQRCGAILG